MFIAMLTLHANMLALVSFTGLCGSPLAHAPIKTVSVLAVRLT